ncbi:MAG: ABC transporter ATP-binding protein [Eubacteriales bacterium]|jgi:ATP-binding cassette subfamily B multidrug efflux pump
MKLLKYLNKYRVQAVLAPLLKLLECFVDLAVPVITANIIDVGVRGGDRMYIIRGCALMVALGLAGLAVSVTAQYFSAVAAVGFSSELRRAAFGHIRSLDYAARKQLGNSTLITRLTGDINQVQSGLNIFLRLFMRSPFIVFGSVVMAFSINPRIALIFAATVPILAVVLFAIMRLTSPLYRNAQTKLDSVVGVTRSTLSGMRVIRAFGREDAETARFAEASDTLAKVQIRAGILSALSNPLSGAVINIATIAVLYMGAIEFSVGVISSGSIVALVNYMSQILIELVKFANLIVQVTRATACASRISSLLDVKPMIDYPAEPAGQTSVSDEAVRFDQVCLTYPGAGGESLTDISFAALRGQTVGIIGGTGSGKTSLVNLIPRFYDATKGEVYINGLPVKELSRDDLRSFVGIVPQKALLFTGTIRSNLLWGVSGVCSPDEISDELLWQALERAQAAEFVRAKPHGLDEPVEQGGRNFSGGQRQRLTVARALVRAAAAQRAKLPFILILDDSASALDFATEAALRRSLAELRGEVTTFIVSQRASSVRSADLILVLDDGRLVGAGRHKELLEDCPVYREICESQYGERGDLYA